MSRTVSDAIVQSFIVPSFQEKWKDLPFDKLHPFSKAVRLVIDSASRLADILDKNDEAEIVHELSLERSCFLCDLKVLLKVEYCPDGNLLTIMPELKEQLLRLKASFTRRYGLGKSKFVVGEIDRLITEICDNPRFDNIYLQKDIYGYFCNFFRILNPSPLAQPTHGESILEMSCSQKALEVMNENFEYADSLPSRNAALLEELKARDLTVEKMQGADKHRVIYECVRIKGKKVKVVRPEWRARFAENVHVMIRSTANLIDAIIKNNVEEIDRNFRPNASPFLTDLHALLETACLPDVHAPQEMRILRSCLRRLKVAFVEHFGAAKSNDVVNGIAKLVDAICDHPQFGNKAVFEELFGCFCKSFKAMKVSKPRESQLQAALKSLKAIVEDACANSKEGAFLFTREDYISIVNELWNNHTSDEYAVSQPDAPAIASLWREIRLKLIEYAKSMIPNPSSLIRDLSNENCWLLFTKFTTVGEKPHVLDTGTVKELFATLSIQEKPRKTIKPKRAQTPKTQKAEETTVDIEGLPVDYRFAVAKDYEIVVDCLHQKPDYECINPYIGLPPTARGIIKKLITSARKKKAEGWCKSEPNWRGAFQKDVAWRFKNQQIEVEKRGGGLYYWRIIPNELFHEHYICKLKPRSPSF